MRRMVGYAKLGRSMPLTLSRCNSLGGDVEMVPTLQLLASRHSDVDFIMVGRNSGERPTDVGLPANVYNPWLHWAPVVRDRLRSAGLTYPNLTITDHQRVAAILHEITGSAFGELNGMVMWLGQHGTSNTPLPQVDNRAKLTKPYDWATLYGSYLMNGINAWRDVDPLNREEVLLNSDPRNYVKFRDLAWPWQHPVLAQYAATRKVKHERQEREQRNFYDFLNASNLLRDNLSYREHGELWTSVSRSVYARLEISALIPGTPFGDSVYFNTRYDRPHNFGMIVNETRREVNPAKARVNVLRDWVLPLGDRVGFINGKWSDNSVLELCAAGMRQSNIHPVPVVDYFAKLQSTRCTFTTPASGSGWATAKPWECFAAGVICFFHPDYDDQDNILGDAPAELRQFLRVSTPEDLKNRVDNISRSSASWSVIVDLQRQHFDTAVGELRYLRLIEERLGL